YPAVSRTGGVPLMVRRREDPALKPYIGKHFFHFHPHDCDQRELFSQKGLRPSWGVASDFQAHTFAELRKYQEGRDDVDYVAVCVGARVAIEKAAFAQLTDDEQRRRFTDEFNKRT